MSRARVLIVADVRGWAWHWKALQLAQHLSAQFDLRIHYHAQDPELTSAFVSAFDLIHTFEFPQVDRIAHLGCPFVTGITAHVAGTWGVDRVRAWSVQARAIHANSMLLLREMQQHQFHEKIYYVPNGVDPKLFYRERPRGRKFCAAYVGKDNPRKGLSIIKEACTLAKVPLKANTRRYANGLDRDGMRDFYQDVWVQVCASDMDGTPNAMLESAACENTLVSTYIGNMPEFIRNGTNGFLVERDAASIAERLAWLAAHPDVCIEMGRQACITALKEWTWERQARNYARMWDEVLRGGL